TKDDTGKFTETVLNGEPIDIPDDVFISVRVEMPADSLYNQKIRAAELAMTTDDGE
ncbi:TPA: phage tail protein, partial [Escherichia coli]|nr:phage tail protein [Escherichia coli]